VPKSLDRALEDGTVTVLIDPGHFRFYCRTRPLAHIFQLDYAEYVVWQARLAQDTHTARAPHLLVVACDDGQTAYGGELTAVALPAPAQGWMLPPQLSSTADRPHLLQIWIPIALLRAAAAEDAPHAECSVLCRPAAGDAAAVPQLVALDRVPLLPPDAPHFAVLTLAPRDVASGDVRLVVTPPGPPDAGGVLAHHRALLTE
jgi:hypothetical protein